MRGPCLARLALCVALLATSAEVDVDAGILFPRPSETREVTTLDGVWRFRASPPEDAEAGFTGQWYKRDLEQWVEMPVPASYNDIPVDAALRDFVGWVFYQRRFFAPRRWKVDARRVFLRFGSVHYAAKVWVNGATAAAHSGGHLPFEGDVTLLLRYGGDNLVTVAVNNTLTRHTIPQGSVTRPNDTSRYPADYVLNENSFDFFNYAGIHRPVYLHTTPRTFIDDVTVVTDVNGTVGVVKYSVSFTAASNAVPTPVRCEVSLLDGVGVGVGFGVAAGVGCDGVLHVPDAELWWPAFMHRRPGHRYTLQVRLVGGGGDDEDIYRLPVGIRVLGWNSGLTINGKTLYLRGVGKHEDSNIRGKGLDYALLVRDYNLLGWLGANSYRTSHYPYAEEALEMADSRGVVVIAESPAVALDFFDAALLDRHKAVMREMLQRDKNRACVIMWSLSNEAMTQRAAAGPYYAALAQSVRAQDPSRPVAFVTNKGADTDNAARSVDVIGVNRYAAWYSDAGQLELVQHQVEADFEAWHARFPGQLLFSSEYGAGAIAGLHSLPVTIWTEDFQHELLRQHFASFDKLREKKYFVGEMVWNFADFATKQGITRVIGNRKGLFTRERQPKMAAHTLRTRYQRLAETLDQTRWNDEL